MADPRIPELVADLEENITACLLRETLIERERARLIAQHAVHHILAHWGGQMIYIPKNQYGGLSERDMVIWQEFNGKNHGALARKYKLTVQQIYNIVRAVSERERAANQQDLFN